MGTLLAYLIKSACCLVLFYLFYKLLLAKETFHRFNRFALLGVLFLSALLPFIRIETTKAVIVQAQVFIGGIFVEPVESDYHFQWQWLLLIVYLIGWLFFLIKIIVSYAQILRSIHKLPSVPLEEGSSIRLILTEKEVSPFSWMNYIVVSKQDYTENGEAILTHEKAHIRKYHSVDMLLCDIFILFQWFNPAAWLLKKELQNIHEFEADEEVIRRGIDMKSYQLLLIKKAVGTQLYSMANSFNHSSIKKRITMMFKQKSNAWARLKYAYVLPLAAISVAAFARTEVSKPLSELSEVKVSDLSSYVKQKVDKSMNLATSDTQSEELQQPKKTKKKATAPAEKEDGVLDMAEQMPQYPGGVGEMMAYLSKTLKYPESCKSQNIHGIVIVQFVIDKTGAVKDAKVIRSVEADMDAEALRVINSMPKWEPGRQNGKIVSVKYTIPIRFSSDKENSNNTSAGKTDNTDGAALQNNNSKFELKNPQNLAIVINGVVKDKEALQNLNKDQIKKIDVIKGEEAKSKYGEENAILITTK